MKYEDLWKLSLFGNCNFSSCDTSARTQRAVWAQTAMLSYEHINFVESLSMPNSFFFAKSKPCPVFRW